MSPSWPTLLSRSEMAYIYMSCSEGGNRGYPLYNLKPIVNTLRPSPTAMPIGPRAASTYDAVPVPATFLATWAILSMKS